MLKKIFSVNKSDEIPFKRSLAVMLGLSVLLVIFQMIVQGFKLSQIFIPILLLNVIPVFMIMTFLYFIIGKISASYTVMNILLSILLVINHYKIKFRSEHLTFEDFSLAKEATNILKNYHLSIDITIVFVIIFTLISIFFVSIKIQNKRLEIKRSLIGIAAMVVIWVITNVTVYSNTFISDTLLSGYTSSAERGLVYTLLSGSNSSEYEMPEGYSKNKVEKILAKYPEAELPDDAPDVIAIMIEAYADIQGWENVEFKGENPYEFFNYLKTKGCYGKTFVPGFGGATASSEFEFLTGNNTSAISSAMPTAYKTHIENDTYSLAQTFKEMGYETIAIHPGDPWFYNRINVYEHMGFDTFLSRDNLPYETPEINYYVKDEITAEMITENYSRHIKEQPENGYFNFTVTIQNHGPYNDDMMMYGDEYISKDHGLTTKEYRIINNYLGGIKAADELLKTIYEYINTLERPTVLMAFGDHLPHLDEDERIFEKLGLDLTSGTFEAYEKRYSTDYIIIGNDAYLENNKPSIKGKQDLITTNYLSLKLFQYMNMELPPFHAFLYDMMQTAPIISRYHVGTTEGFDAKPGEEFDKTLKNYKILQYYNLKEYEVK